jgi:hypothetical protein
MDRRKDNVIPFRRPARKKWTRPEDFLPSPPKPRRDWRAVRRTAGVWLTIALLVAATVATTLWF